MKTGIVTVYNPLDYGNRLQNYAMHRILSDVGLECETLIPRQHKKSQYRRKRENAVRDLYRKNPSEAQMKSPVITRAIRFEQFENQYVPLRKLNTVSFPHGLSKEYRWFVTGGDRVWNPWLRDNLGKMENCLLAFGQCRQRRCMSPSIGAVSLPEHLHCQYHAQWIKFPWLNVRFPEDAQLIREITGREADILPDPVLLIDPAHWQELMSPLPDFDEQKPYCLAWLTENTLVTGEMEERIGQLSGNAPLERYFLGNQEKAPVSTAGPSEFLYLMKNARMVVTDSYYGAVFAVIFGKPFVFTAPPEICSPDTYAVTRQVTSMLQMLKVSYVDDRGFLWVSQPAASLPERAHAVDLLKKMFQLDRIKPEEVSCR